MGTLLDPRAVRQQPIDALKIARKMRGKCALIDAGEYDEQKATDRRKKIICCKMQQMCNIFEEREYILGVHRAYTPVPRHQVKEDDRSNRWKKIR